MSLKNWLASRWLSEHESSPDEVEQPFNHFASRWGSTRIWWIPWTQCGARET